MPPGEALTIGQFTIPDGMVYIDPTHARSDYYDDLPAIDPTRRVDWSEPSWDDDALPYWPRYREIDARTRAGYLQWLASGRVHAAAPNGFLFLFFYGIEHRLLVDAPNGQVSAEEAAILRAELHRLLETYPERNSFTAYASQLLAFLFVQNNSRRRYELPPPPESNNWELPFDLRLGLGQLVADGKVIPVNWALSWLVNSDFALRTPAVRCADEFANLFAIRFAERFGEGMRLKPNRARLRIEYRPAGPGMPVRSIDVGEIPDVTVLKRPINQLRALAEHCTDELDSYSRYLGKNPDGRGSPEAFAFLPDVIGSSFDGDAIVSMRSWLADLLSPGAHAVLPAKQLFARWETSNPAKMSRREAVGLAQFLQKLGAGIEPDVRFVGKPLTADGLAVVFRLAAGASDTPSDAYRVNSLLLHLAVMVAAADGVVSAEEKVDLERHLESVKHMDPHEHERLKAHLQWLITEPPGAAGLKKRLAKVSQQERERIAEIAVFVAGADGRIEPSEVDVLRKIYTALELDPEKVYSDLHALSAPPATEPVVVRLAAKRRVLHKIPAAPIPQSSASNGSKRFPAAAARQTREPSFQLDMARVQDKLQDTAAVSHLLASIFTDDNQEPEPTITSATASTASADPAPGTSAVGLDADHSALVRRLASEEQVTRADFERFAAGLGLFPDGALELLNDAAIEHCDELLLEGDDPIDVNTEVLERMML